MQTSGVDYKVAVGLTGEQLFDILSKQVAETTKALGGVTTELGKVNTSLSGAGGAARGFGSDMSGASHEAEGGISMLTGRLGELAAAVGIAFSVEKVVEWGKEVMNVTAEMQGYENRIKFASLDTEDAQKNMAFLNKEVAELHLPIKGVNEGFSQMEAGLMGTGIEGEKLRQLVWGIGEAAATVHLNDQDMSGTLLAIKEIGEVGLNMRLEKMLIRDLPGVGNAVRKAFGKSMSELEKEGITGPQFLQGLAPALDAYYRSGVANYSKSLQASMVDTDNAIYLEQAKVGTQLEDFYKGILGDMRSFVYAMGNDVIKAIDFVKEHKETLKQLGNVVKDLAIIYLSYKGTLLALLAVEKIQLWWEGASALAQTILASYTALTALGYDGLTASILATTAAMEANPLGLIVAGMAAISVAAYEAYTSIEDMNAELDKTGEKINWDKTVPKLTKFQLALKELADLAKAIGYTFEWAYDKITFQSGAAANAWEKAMNFTNEADEIDEGRYGKIGGAGGSWDDSVTVNKTLSDQRTTISSAAEGNKVRNVIVNIAQQIGVQTMTYDQHTQNPKHLEREMTEMLVNSTRDAEIALGRN